jgi:hypothetical protein
VSELSRDLGLLEILLVAPSSPSEDRRFSCQCRPSAFVESPRMSSKLLAPSRSGARCCDPCARCSFRPARRRQDVVEFPDPACVEAQAALKKMMRDARNAFLDCKGLQPSSDKPFHPLSGEATINGVGFFDRPHATGHAPHGIELHPVLFFSSSDC